jgi:DNA-binding MarR family transcriptional regulator
MKRYRSTIAGEIKQSRPFRSAYHEAAIALLKTADMVRRYTAQVILSEDITPQQYNVLRILRGAGAEGLPTLEIGERMIEEVPGVTRLVDRLEKRKLLKRSPNPSDRRQVICRITADGKHLLERLDGPIGKVDNDMLSILDRDDLEHLLKILDEIRAHLAPGPASGITPRKGAH